MGIAKGNITKQKEIGHRIRNLRINKGVTQNEIANLLGMKAAGYSKLESGGCALGYEHCITLSDFYGVTCDYILRGINAENVDVFRSTGLHQKSLEILKNLQSSKDGLLNDLESYCNSKDYYAAHKTAFDYDISVIKEYLINSLIADDFFLDDFAFAAYQIADASAKRWRFRNFDDPGFMSNKDPDTLEMCIADAEREFTLARNAAQYIASQAASRLFYSLSRNPLFFDYLHENAELHLEPEDIAYGCENGYLDIEPTERRALNAAQNHQKRQ